MTLNFFQLKEPPFGAIPDRRFLFVSTAHRLALGTLLLGLQEGNSAVSLVGRTGLGKTTLLFHMFKGLADNVTAVYLFQPPQTPLDLVRAILVDLGVGEMEEIPEEMLRLLRDLLADQVRQQKRVVVVIDEAQNLEPEVLEVLWMLANPAGPQGHLLQFVLSGQADMAEPPVDPESTELTYRSPIVARLEPLNGEDTALYIDYRLRVAGYNRDQPLFTPEANLLIAKYSDGVPRKINNLCFSCMALAYKTKQRTIEAGTVRAVIADLGLDRLRQRVIGVEEDAAAPPAELPPPSVHVFPMPSVRPQEAEKAEPRPVAPAARLRRRPSAPEQRPHPVVPFPAVAKAARPASQLVPKLGLVAAVLLTVTATLVTVRRHAPQAPAAPPGAVSAPASTASPLATPAASAQPPAPKTAARAATVAPPRSDGNLKGMDLKAAVRALHGRSLSDLCKANFGQCDGKQLQEMQKVNPRVKSSAHAAARSGAGPSASEAVADQVVSSDAASPN